MYIVRVVPATRPLTLSAYIPDQARTLPPLRSAMTRLRRHTAKRPLDSPCRARGPGFPPDRQPVGTLPPSLSPVYITSPVHGVVHAWWTHTRRDARASERSHATARIHTYTHTYCTHTNAHTYTRIRRATLIRAVSTFA